MSEGRNVDAESRIERGSEGAQRASTAAAELAHELEALAEAHTHLEAVSERLAVARLRSEPARTEKRRSDEEEGS